jgi:hypothetical protein
MSTTKLTSSSEALCSVCGGGPARHCSGCRSVRYCSVKCQKKDFKEHKVICKAMHIFKVQVKEMHELVVGNEELQDFWTQFLEFFIAFQCDLWAPGETGQQIHPQTYFPKSFQQFVLDEYTKRGGDINACSRQTAWSLLHNSAFRGELEVCQLLIDNGNTMCNAM